MPLRTYGRRAALGVLLAASWSAAPPPPPEPPRHSETILVREAGVLVERPASRPIDTLKRARRPGDFQLLLDGLPHEVVSIEAATAKDWEIVVYLDPELAPAGPLNDAVLLLAKRAERLSGLGTVELVIADPEPRVALAPSRDAAVWRAALAELAGTAGGRAASLPETRLLAAVRRQCDRLTAFASRSRSSRPRALFWVGALDLPISPAESNALTLATEPGRETVSPTPPIAAAFAEATQALAAYGWVTIPLAVRPPPPPPPPTERPPGGAALDRPDYNSTLGRGRPLSFPEDPKAKARRASADLRLDAALLPWLAPHHLLARATAGRVVQDELQFDDALASLGRRWWLWYRPPVPADGRLHRLAVSLDGKVSLGGKVGLDAKLSLSGDVTPDGNRLAAPAWVRGFPGGSS
ncbi:MAG: hypothetical protein QOJ16_91 [Acidobacteriota bacterium]|jgi:hypothetical protein|nr:hypothetical protein [Acidobacteriota bacterium]